MNSSQHRCIYQASASEARTQQRSLNSSLGDTVGSPLVHLGSQLLNGSMSIRSNVSPQPLFTSVIYGPWSAKEERCGDIKDILRGSSHVMPQAYGKNSLCLFWRHNVPYGQLDPSYINLETPINKCQRSTVQRTLIDRGFRSHRPFRVPLLTQWHKALWLVWARQHCRELFSIRG
ncbi:hypothetical protein TNCV_3871671 [Trichonephila clavipes]|nr:hypothetical protein TNCV_3871671 [Trichonephila clavipes]